MPPKTWLNKGLSIFTTCSPLSPLLPATGPSFPISSPLPTRTSPTSSPVPASRSRSPKGQLPPMLATRKDTPFIRNNRNRGSLSKALSAGEDEESKTSALQVYENLTRATSAQLSTSSLWKTWVTIHEHWFGTGPDSLPVLPLAPESIRAVVASLIKGDYRSAPNYVTVAKDKHLANYPWDSMLEREHHRAGKASTRGLGPSHQCAELPVMLAYVHSKDLPSKPRYPVGATHMIVCASFFI